MQCFHTRCSVRRALSTLAVAALAAAATGCTGQADPDSLDAVVPDAQQVAGTSFTVTYEVDGAGIGSLDFNDGQAKPPGEGGSSEAEMLSVMGPTVPWRKTVKLKGLERPAVSAVANGKAVCRITHKGKVLAEQTAESTFASVSCAADSPLKP